YPFGWDTTPAIFNHGQSYSIVLKDNHYYDGSSAGGPYFITQLSQNLQIEWQYKNIQTKSCVRNTDGSMDCSEETAGNGFEWCVNAPAIDSKGNVHVNAEDGYVYVIGQGGNLVSRTFLNRALGAAYTPTTIDAKGRIYALNNGELSVLGK